MSNSKITKKGVKAQSVKRKAGAKLAKGLALLAPLAVIAAA